MIQILKKRVRIKGEAEEIFEDLIALHLTIMQDYNLLELGTKAITEAGKTFRENGYEIHNMPHENE